MGRCRFPTVDPAFASTESRRRKKQLRMLEFIMNLKTILLSSDEKTVRILRRVLGDLEIDVEHCATAEAAIRQITRQRFEGIIVDVSDMEEAGTVLRAAKAAPVNKRALAIVLVESAIGMKGGFEIGAHFVLHKPFAVERAKASFRAVRALMKRERRMQMRIPVQVPVECFGARRYKATTLDVCEGGMAIQFSGRAANESPLRFSLELPGMKQALEIYGELAWGGNEDQAGVRFKDASDEQVSTLRQWLSSQLPEREQDDPPVNCRVTELSPGGCYLTTTSPFPRGTNVSLLIKTANFEIRAKGFVLVAHPESGMGVEFLQKSDEQRDQAKRLFTTLRAKGDAPEIQVEPEGLERLHAGDHSDMAESMTEASGPEDALVDLFRHKFQAPVETFMKQMREQRQSVESR
jgi:DNA-binding response OmpR family regulator